MVMSTIDCFGSCQYRSRVEKNRIRVMSTSFRSLASLLAPQADTLALPWVIAGLQQEGVLSQQEVEKVKGEGGKVVVVLASKGSPALRGLCRVLEGRQPSTVSSLLLRSTELENEELWIHEESSSSSPVVLRERRARSSLPSTKHCSSSRWGRPTPPIKPMHLQALVRDR